MMNTKEKLLERKEELLKKIAWLEKELNEEKDNEDTWGGHEGPGYMDLENDLQIRVQMLKEVERKLMLS